MATTFYTPNGWQGRKYDMKKGAKEVAAELREYIKHDAELSACKWSITTKWGMNADTLTVTLTAAPFDPFTDEYKRTHADNWDFGYIQNAIHREKSITEQANRLLGKVRAFVIPYICDDSDAQIDYFDRNIYDRYDIGKYDKPFKQIEAPQTTPKERVKQTANADSLRLVDYSEKSVALIGDTKAIKDKLKELGGRFNTRLTCGAGWIFSKRKEPELRALFAL